MNLSCKCGNESRFYVKTTGNFKGIHCDKCSRWQCWVSNSELELLYDLRVPEIVFKEGENDENMDDYDLADHEYSRFFDR